MAREYSRENLSYRTDPELTEMRDDLQSKRNMSRLTGVIAMASTVTSLANSQTADTHLVRNVLLGAATVAGIAALELTRYAVVDTFRIRRINKELSRRQPQPPTRPH